MGNAAAAVNLAAQHVREEKKFRLWPAVPGSIFDTECAQSLRFCPDTRISVFIPIMDGRA